MHNLKMQFSQTTMGVGLVGTGYAAKLRAEAVRQDPRSHLVAVVGHSPEKTATFVQELETESVDGSPQLIERQDIDLVIVSTINRDHGTIARAALENGKHVIVEYPLSIDLQTGQELVTLAKSQQKLLHVEHIELLGGLHQALKQHISKIGDIFYVRYSTINHQHPAPRKWTYDHEMFGFPLIGAISRLHRLIDLFGEVLTVNCHQRYWQIEAEYYQTCLCTTQLCFKSGLLAQVVYGKGETLWHSERKFEVHGEKGGLIFDGDTGLLVQPEETTVIDVGNRRGLFVKDTTMVLDYLFDGTPLYVTPEQSLYTLKVADAAQRAAQTGLTTFLN